jgi:hypothetical protein
MFHPLKQQRQGLNIGCGQRAFCFLVCMSFFHFTSSTSGVTTKHGFAPQSQQKISLAYAEEMVFGRIISCLSFGALIFFRIRKARRLQRCDSVIIGRIVTSFIGFMFINALIVFGPEFYRHLLFPALVLAFSFWRFGPGTSGIATKTRWDD